MRDESGRQFATHVAAANAACPASCFFGFAKLSGVWLSPHRTVFFGLFKPVEIPGTNDTTRSKVGSAVGQHHVVFKTVMSELICYPFCFMVKSDCPWQATRFAGKHG
jgi:hypothetical protein